MLQEFRLVNESAAKCLNEGFEEIITLHQLGVFTVLGGSLNSRTPDEKKPWIVAALLDIEPGSAGLKAPGRSWCCVEPNKLNSVRTRERLGPTLRSLMARGDCFAKFN